MNLRNRQLPDINSKRKRNEIEESKSDQSSEENYEISTVSHFTL